MNNELWDRREEFTDYMEKTFGYAMLDWAEIDDYRPFKSIREGIRDFLGSDVKVSNDEVREILKAANGCEMYRSGNIRFFDPNVFITLVATFVEV